MKMKRVSVSPSGTYVAMCNKTSFEGYYFKKFALPSDAENNSDYAAWYFLNRLNAVACLEHVVTLEDYNNLEEAKSSEYADLFNGNNSARSLVAPDPKGRE